MTRFHAYSFMPTGVDATVDEIRSAHGPTGPALALGLRVTSDDRSDDWAVTHALLVVEEDGELRVCADLGHPEA